MMPKGLPLKNYAASFFLNVHHDKFHDEKNY